MHVNDTFGQAMTKGIGAMLPRLHAAAVQDRRHHLLRPGGEGPDGRGVEGQGGECRLPPARLPPERRDHPAPRDGEAALEPDGHRQPGLARACTRSSTSRRSASYREYSISNVPWYNPNVEAHQGGREGVHEAEPEGQAGVPRLERRLHLRGHPDRGRRLQARREAPIRRRWPTRSARPTSPTR